MRKTLFSATLLAMAAWLNVGSAMAWDEPTQVNGVYQIGTGSELEWFAEYVNSAPDAVTTEEKEARLFAKAVLTADIDMQGIDHAPIGANEPNKYNGVFDGQHHVIKNLVIERPLEDNPANISIGLFGWVRGGTTLKNIVLDATCSFTGYNRVGSIVGCIQTNVADDPLEILNCVSFATLVSKRAAGMIGAGAEQYPYFEMENCVNAGPITAQDKASVFCGWNKSAGGNAKMYNCYNIADIGGVLDGGNIFFRGANREIKNCYDFGNQVSSNTQVVKPTWVTADPVHSGELCFALNNDNSLTYNSGIVAYTQDLSDPNSIPMPVANGKKVYKVADLDCAGNPKGGVSFSNVEGGTRDAHNYVDGFCSVCGDVDENWITESEDGYYHFSTVKEIEWWSDMVRKKWHGCMNVKLDADIDFGGVPNAHYPIGTSGHKWAAKFDGQGHHIKGMVITKDLVQDNVYDGLGFFGSVRGGVEDTNWKKKTTEVEIKNLFIDADCSINHTSNFAAGIVGHINSTFSGANITIENCGNEATVYTTGKNAAGILGCVEGTNVGLILHNLWNKGNITGKGGESAAICAWTGQRNVDGEVDVEGCWNIGEVEGIDGNGYNMVRRNSNIKPRNMVDLCLTNKGNQGKVSTLNTDNPIASGELCYLLNGDQNKIVYTQNLDEDAMPVYGTTSKQVYQAGTIDCTGASVGSLTYNNVSGETIKLDHNISEEIGMCSVCHTQFQEPALVDGFYQLKNAGHVEWFAAKINGGDLTASAKLMNDIDMLAIENLHTPIGNTEGQKFNGTFDGQGFRIKNMIINRPANDYQGFFGYFRGNANNTTVRNLIIDKSCSIHGNNRIGGLVGAYQNGGMTITIENVINEAEVIAEHQDAAGIIGGHVAGTPTIIIRNVINAGNITAKNEHPYAGALCCYLGLDQATSKLENFLNLGTVNGHEGGNIGRHNFANATNVIDLSATEDKTQGVVEGLTTEDLANGKVASIMGWGQLIGEDATPSPFNNETVYAVGEAGFATMVADADCMLNNNAQAYIVNVNAAGTYAVLTEVDDVPAGTAVVVAGTYYNKLATKATSDVTANELKVSTEDIAADGSQYVLAKPADAEIGFYKATSGTIKAGKAYLKATTEAKALLFGFGESEDAIQNVNENVNVNAIYNLAGQRLNKTVKGINIVNGKKVILD